MTTVENSRYSRDPAQAAAYLRWKINHVDGVGSEDEDDAVAIDTVLGFVEASTVPRAVDAASSGEAGAELVGPPGAVPVLMTGMRAVVHGRGADDEMVRVEGTVKSVGTMSDPLVVVLAEDADSRLPGAPAPVGGRAHWATEQATLGSALGPLIGGDDGASHDDDDLLQVRRDVVKRAYRFINACTAPVERLTERHVLATRTWERLAQVLAPVADVTGMSPKDRAGLVELLVEDHRALDGVRRELGFTGREVTRAQIVASVREYKHMGANFRTVAKIVREDPHYPDMVISKVRDDRRFAVDIGPVISEVVGEDAALEGIESGATVEALRALAARPEVGDRVAVSWPGGEGAMSLWGRVDKLADAMPAVVRLDDAPSSTAAREAEQIDRLLRGMPGGGGDTTVYTRVGRAQSVAAHIDDPKALIAHARSVGLVLAEPVTALERERGETALSTVGEIDAALRRGREELGLDHSLSVAQRVSALVAVANAVTGSETGGQRWRRAGRAEALDGLRVTVAHWRDTEQQGYDAYGAVVDEMDRMRETDPDAPTELLGGSDLWRELCEAAGGDVFGPRESLLRRVRIARESSDGASRFEFEVSEVLGASQDDFAAYRARTGVEPSPSAARAFLLERLRATLDAWDPVRATLVPVRSIVYSPAGPGIDAEVAARIVTVLVADYQHVRSVVPGWPRMPELVELRDALGDHSLPLPQAITAATAQIGTLGHSASALDTIASAALGVVAGDPAEDASGAKHDYIPADVARGVVEALGGDHSFLRAMRGEVEADRQDEGTG